MKDNQTLAAEAKPCTKLPGFRSTQTANLLHKRDLLNAKKEKYFV
jgi:hypothetical protein